MKKFTGCFVLVLVTLLVLSLKIGWEKNERVECAQWQKWAKEIKGFYLTPWQAEQCERWGVKIDAPVEGRKR